MFRFRRRADPVTPPAPAAGARLRSGIDAEHLLRELEWTVIRRLDGLLLGDYRTLLRGSGLDLADLREYQPTDDVRRIDWNATARSAEPQVREFEEDRSLCVWFLLDLSASVDFGTTGLRKRDVSARLVAVLARLFARHGNRVGAVLHGHGGPSERVIPAGTSRGHLLRLIDAVLAPPGQEPTARDPDGTRARQTDLTGLLLRTAGMLRQRSLVILVSDFLSPPGWEQALARLSRRHEVIAVRLHDPLEATLPDLGLVLMQDAESGEQLLVDAGDRHFRRRFAQASVEREAALRQSLAAAGVDGLELATAEPIDQALLAFARLRRQRARLAAGGGAPGHRSPTRAASAGVAPETPRGRQGRQP